VRPTITGNQYLDQQRERSVAYLPRRVKTPSVGIVLDTQYILTTAMKWGRTRIDYPRIIAEVAAGADWVGVACVARPLTNKPIDGFLAYLSTLGLASIVWQSPVAAGQKKVNLDTLVVREATCLAVESGLRELCIVGPDCDYYVVGELCRQRGIKFTVAGFRNSIGGFMRAQADRVVELGRQYLMGEAA
jgi:uncharacterized LabA/DUF88 family protein